MLSSTHLPLWLFGDAEHALFLCSRRRRAVPTARSLQESRSTMNSSPLVHDWRVGKNVVRPCYAVIHALLWAAIALHAVANALVAEDRSQDLPSGREGVLLATTFDDDGWWKHWGMDAPPVNTSLVEGDHTRDGNGRALKVKVRRGEHMGTSFVYKFEQQIGIEPEEIYFRYDLKFDKDWQHATSGGKLPGISGTYGRAGWGGRRVNGHDGWSARGLFDNRSGGDATDVGFYCYHVDMRGRYGSHWEFTPPLEHGRWYTIEMYCKLNTPGLNGSPGLNDGILRGWIDGRLGFEKTDVRFRDVADLKIEQVWGNVYHGGATDVPDQDIHLYLDNMVIARQRIEPAQAD